MIEINFAGLLEWVFPICTAVIGGFILERLKRMDSQKVKSKEENEKNEESRRAQIQANSEGIKVMIRYMLKRYHSEYMVQGFITSDQLADWQEMYDIYRALKGNGLAVAYNRDIMALPVRNDIPNESPYMTLLRKCKEEK